MLLALKQRALLLACCIVAALLWLPLDPWLMPFDGSSGITIADASVGPWLALAAAWIAAALTAAVGALAMRKGRRLSPIIATGFAIALLGWRSGGSAGWFDRAHLPGDVRWLMLETFHWVLIYAAIMAGIITLYRWRDLQKHLKRDRTPRPRAQTPLLDHPGEAALAGLTSALLAGFFAFLLMRHNAVGQLLVSLFLAFFAGGLVAQLVFRRAGAAFILISPLVVAMVAYLRVWLGYPDDETLLLAMYRDQLPGLARALPIHYAGAGILGAVIGVAWAQSIIRGNREDAAISDAVGSAVGLSGLKQSFADQARDEHSQQTS